MAGALTSTPAAVTVSYRWLRRLAFRTSDTAQGEWHAAPAAGPSTQAGLGAARTGNRLGWLFLGAAVASAVVVVAYAYAARAATARLPGAAWAAWIFTVV